MVSVKSDVDNDVYVVRDLPDKQTAANMLAKIKQNIFYISNYLFEHIKNYPEYKQYISQLHSRIQNCIIMESSENSIYTSYSVNKGEQIVFCIRSRDKDHKRQLHSLNLMMYVALHEMSHVACPENGHTELFRKIFEFIATTGVELGKYKRIPFAEQPVECCGLIIKASII